MEAWYTGFSSASGILNLLSTFHYECVRYKIFYMAISNYIAHVQHIRKYLPELLSLISELWSSFSLPAANRSVHGSPVSMASFKYLLFI